MFKEITEDCYKINFYIMIVCLYDKDDEFFIQMFESKDKMMKFFGYTEENSLWCAIHRWRKNNWICDNEKYRGCHIHIYQFRKKYADPVSKRKRMI